MHRYRRQQGHYHLLILFILVLLVIAIWHHANTPSVHPSFAALPQGSPSLEPNPPAKTAHQRFREQITATKRRLSHSLHIVTTSPIQLKAQLRAIEDKDNFRYLDVNTHYSNDVIESYLANEQHNGYLITFFLDETPYTVGSMTYSEADENSRPYLLIIALKRTTLSQLRKEFSLMNRQTFQLVAKKHPLWQKGYRVYSYKVYLNKLQQPITDGMHKRLMQYLYDYRTRDVFIIPSKFKDSRAAQLTNIKQFYRAYKMPHPHDMADLHWYPVEFQ